MTHSAHFRPRMGFALTAVTGLVFGLTGCGAAEPDLVGVWDPDDGSGTKTINDNGTCSGMYYSQGKPLDIGGVATCTLGEKSQDGAYSLVVRQPPNETTYLISFEDNDTAVLMSKSGKTIVTLSRL